MPPDDAGEFEYLPFGDELFGAVTAHFEAAGLGGGDVDVGSKHARQVGFAPIGRAIGGDLHRLAVERLYRHAGLGLFGLEVDHADAVVTVATGDVHGAGKAVLGVDDFALALDEFELLGVFPLNYGTGVDLQVVGDRHAIVVLFEGVVYATAEVGGLFDLGKGFVDDAVGEVVVGLAAGALEAHRGERDLAHFPLVELWFGEDAEDRGDTREQLQTACVAQCGGPKAAAPRTGQAVARCAVGFVPVRGLGLVFFKDSHGVLED